MTDLDRLTAALQRLQTLHGCFTVQLAFSSVVTLIAQVQLALRHPSNRGLPATEARAMVNDMIDALAAQEPELGELLRRGFCSEYDMPVYPASLSQRAFDVMMRRGVFPVQVKDGWSVWCVHPTGRILPLFHATAPNVKPPPVWQDPFTALVEGDEWYRKNVEEPAARKLAARNPERN